MTNDTVNAILQKEYPDREVVNFIDFNGRIIVAAVDKKDPDEGMMDGFFEINPSTKEVSEFSIYNRDDRADILNALFGD